MPPRRERLANKACGGFHRTASPLFAKIVSASCINGAHAAFCCYGLGVNGIGLSNMCPVGGGAFAGCDNRPTRSDIREGCPVVPGASELVDVTRMRKAAPVSINGEVEQRCR